MKKKTVLLILFGICCIAAFFRLYLLPTNLFFGPEQGRDLLVVRDMVDGNKFTLIGAKTDIAGVFHGPLFYYLAAIPFLLSGGNPQMIAIFFAIIQVIAIPALYLLVMELTNNKRLGLITSLLFALSFESIVYARWLSNPPLSLVIAIIFFLCFLRFIKGNRWYLVIAAICYGVLGQLEFVNYALFGGIIIALGIRYWRELKKTPISVVMISCIIGGAVAFGTYVLFDIRHGFLVTNSLVSLIQGGGFRGSFFAAAGEMSGRYITEIGRTFGIFNSILSGLIGLIGIYGWFVLRKSFRFADSIIIWMIVPILVLFAFRHGVLEQVFVGLLPAWIIGLSIVLEQLWKTLWLGKIIVLFIATYAICMYFFYIPSNEQVFFQKSQARIRYSDELSVVNAIYGRADGKPFYFQSFTIPIFWQDGWTYLFWYIGTTKYGYVPVEEDKSTIYVIIPKIYSDPFLSLFQSNWYKDTVSTWGRLTYSFSIGEFTIEERQK